MIMGQTTNSKPPLGWRNTVPNFQVILTSAMCVINFGVMPPVAMLRKLLATMTTFSPSKPFENWPTYMLLPSGHGLPGTVKVWGHYNKN